MRILRQSDLQYGQIAQVEQHLDSSSLESSCSSPRCPTAIAALPRDADPVDSESSTDRTLPVVLDLQTLLASSFEPNHSSSISSLICLIIIDRADPNPCLAVARIEAR